MVADAELERTQQDHQIYLLALCRRLKEFPVPENVVKCSSNSDAPTTEYISMLDSLGWGLGILAIQYQPGAWKSDRVS